MVDIDALYIVHFCHPSCKPFQNICRLPKEEAFAHAYKMAAEIVAVDPEGDSHYRFAEGAKGFESYYPRRMMTDEYLYHSFISLGGKPREKHPLFFVLQGSEWLHNWFGNGLAFRIKLNSIPSEYISFTMGDSGALTKKAGVMVQEIQGGSVAIYTKEMLLNSIQQYNGTIDNYMAYVAEQYRYIEVQLWNDDYCVT